MIRYQKPLLPLLFLLSFSTSLLGFTIDEENAGTGENAAISQGLLENLDQRAAQINQGEIADIPTVDERPSLNNFNKSQWGEAIVWKLPWEINRGENRTAPADTYVLMKSGSSEMYFAFVSYDPDPDKIRATFTDRDNWSVDNDDAVGFYIDTYNDGRNAYRVMVNAAGIQADAERLDRGAQGTDDDSSFDFLWHSEVTRFENGYIAQMIIPLDNLQIPNGKEGTLEMGFLPIRMMPRDFTHKISPVEWNFDRNCFLCQMPAIRLNSPGSQGAPLQVIPYASGSSEGSGSGSDITAHDVEATGSIGLDMKYQRGPSVIDATILPDFSQVEADAFQMTSNVRFAPRVSEQRPFFMERSDLFRFPISQTLYTRSIVDPTAGARWTGKTDSHNWAVISMHDQTGWLLDPGPQSSQLRVDDEVSSWNNLFRYRYDHSSDLSMGMFYSDRITEDGYNRLVSHDSQIGLGSNHTFVFQGLAAWNRYPERFSEQYGVPSGDMFDYGYLMRMSRSGRNFDYRLETRRYGDELITGTGILQQTGVQTATLRSGYNFWRDDSAINRVRLWTRNNADWLLNDGNLSDVISDPDLLSYQLRPGISLYGVNRLRVITSFTLSHENVIGDIGGETTQQGFDLYGYWALFSKEITPDYRLMVNGSYGTAVDYRLVEKMNEYDISVSNSLLLFNRSLDLSHEFNYLRLYHDVTAQEAFTQRLSAEFQITTNFAIRNILQYRDFRFEEPRYGDDVPDQVRTVQNQMLLRYRMNHAAAVYLGGFTDIGETAPRAVGDPIQEQSEWQIFAKISYLL